MKQNKIQIIIGAISLVLLTLFVANHFNKPKKAEKNPFLSQNPSDSIDRLQVKSDIDPDAIYPPDFVIAKFRKRMLEFKDIPMSARFDLYRIKLETYLKSLVTLKEMFIIMSSYIDSKMGYPDVLPSIAKVLTIEPPTRLYIEEEYEKVKDTYPIKDPDQAKIQLTQDTMLEWHTKVFFKRLDQLERDNVFKIYLLPPKHPDLSFIKKDDIAKLGNKNAEYKLEIFTNYGCKRCQRLNLQVSEAFKVLNNKLQVHQFIISPPAKTKFNTLEFYLSNYMNCALKIDSDAYWKIHVNLIQNKPFLSKMDQDLSFSKSEIQDVFKQNLNENDYKTWDQCSHDQEALKTTDSLSRLSESLLGINSHPTFYLNGRFLDVTVHSLTATIKEALSNPNW